MVLFSYYSAAALGLAAATGIGAAIAAVKYFYDVYEQFDKGDRIKVVLGYYGGKEDSEDNETKLESLRNNLRGFKDLLGENAADLEDFDVIMVIQKLSFCNILVRDSDDEEDSKPLVVLLSLEYAVCHKVDKQKKAKVIEDGIRECCRNIDDLRFLNAVKGFIKF